MTEEMKVEVKVEEQKLLEEIEEISKVVCMKCDVNQFSQGKSSAFALLF